LYEEKANRSLWVFLRGKLSYDEMVV